MKNNALIENELRAKDAEIARLREALKPFAEWIAKRDADYTTAAYPDPCPLAYSPDKPNADAATVGDLRRARAALAREDD